MRHTPPDRGGGCQDKPGRRECAVNLDDGEILPVVFVHGVNTRRSDDGYSDAVAARESLIRRLLLDPLGGSLRAMEVVDAYWGDAGVRFRWNLASVPPVSLLDVYGDESSDVDESDLVFSATVDELSGFEGISDSEEREDGILRRAARQDLLVFLETILAPVLLAELRLSDADSTHEGELAAALAIAVETVAREDATREAVEATSSDDELMNLLEARVGAAFDELLPPDQQTELEGYGWLDDAKDRITEIFGRARSAPARAATVPALTLWRTGLHTRLSRFMGDIFVYLDERGEENHPGPIVIAVRDAIHEAQARADDDEPLIVITHSMGGNIVYDLLTYFAPEMEVALWVSVGGQVAQFEEMKLFRASEKSIGTPDKVSGLKPRVRYWLNVYDAVDPFGFMAEPVFADVDADVSYSTGAGGMKAHGDYFGRASFYRLVRKHLEKALL